MLRLNKGKIAVGYDADFIVVSDNYDVEMTVINSEII
jgi:N-acetylglucosamine-6-phosphate deacetylase